MWHSLFIKGPSLPGFLEIPGDITGISIASISNISVESCAKLCSNWPAQTGKQCCSVKYSPSKKECHHYKECLPNVNVPFGDYILYQKGIWVNFFYLGKCKEKIPLLLLLFTESCFQNGIYSKLTIYIDNVLERLENFSSAHDCQKKCQEHQDCQFWSFRSDHTGHCFLQSYDAALNTMHCEPTFSCIRGPKFCPYRGR